MKAMKWKRRILPFDWCSDYKATDGNSLFRITRHRKTSKVMLFIWRKPRNLVSEKYDYLPSVRYAKQFAESRRDQQEKVSKRGNKRVVDNPLVW